MHDEQRDFLARHLAAESSTAERSTFARPVPQRILPGAARRISECDQTALVGQLCAIR